MQPLKHENGNGIKKCNDLIKLDQCFNIGLRSKKKKHICRRIFSVSGGANENYII